MIAYMVYLNQSEGGKRKKEKERERKLKKERKKEKLGKRET